MHDTFSKDYLARYINNEIYVQNGDVARVSALEGGCLLRWTLPHSRLCIRTCIRSGYGSCRDEMNIHTGAPSCGFVS